MDPVCLVVSTLPDRDSAVALAHALLEQRIAACVNLLSECASVYRWQGEIETANEVPVLIKTRESLYPQVEELIQRLHPYEVPEVVMVRVSGGLPAYLEWVSQETVTG